MCEPLTMLGLLGLAGSVGSAALGVAGAAKPPEPTLPAAPAPTGRAPGATVRVGTGADELENTDPTKSDIVRTPVTRAAGTALGGLGRSTLAL